MNSPYCVPSEEAIKTAAERVPEYMHPNLSPYLVVWEGLFKDEVCDLLIDECMKEESYKFPRCHAETRECSRPLSYIFDPLVRCIEDINQLYWKFDLDENPGAWLQSYFANDSYTLHTDGIYGQTRKLTAIVLLSHPYDYEGGLLRFVSYPETHYIPKTRGTMCVFPPWMLHEVFPVTYGLRQSLNVGFWGPPFR